jgi:hypothetical protein
MGIAGARTVRPATSAGQSHHPQQMGAVFVGRLLCAAGGKIRIGAAGSMLGVHRFVALTPGRDPVAETQRIAGAVLNYLTRMGVSSAVMEAMSAISDIRWLGAKEAAAMSLVTDPARR